MKFTTTKKEEKILAMTTEQMKVFDAWCRLKFPPPFEVEGCLDRQLTIITITY